MIHVSSKIFAKMLEVGLIHKDMEYEVQDIDLEWLYEIYFEIARFFFMKEEWRGGVGDKTGNYCTYGVTVRDSRYENEEGTDWQLIAIGKSAASFTNAMALMLINMVAPSISLVAMEANHG